MDRTPDSPTVTAAALGEVKSRLSAYVRAVQRGGSITITNFGRPVAKLVPYVAEELGSRRPEPGSIHDVRLPPPPRRRIDLAGALRAERKR